MKKLFLSALFLATVSFSFAQKNLTLLSNYTFAPGVTCAGVWHYNDSLGNEYALVGTSNGLSIFNITNPYIPQRLFDVPDTIGEWREVKVWSHYAYVSNEGGGSRDGGGITIVDMKNLPDTPVYKKYTGDSTIVATAEITTIAGQLSTAHTVQVVDGFLYINGSNISHQGTLICSLADPWNPKYVGAYDHPNTYVHDCFVRGDTLITSEIYIGQFTISIMSAHKDTITSVASQSTPSLFNHSTWMSDDDHYLFTTDEKPRAPLASYDISNLSNIQLLDLYWTTKNNVGEVHNPRVLNDFLVNSCYGDSVHTGSQVTLVDASRPANLIEVGNFQLCPPGPGLMICWDADPFTKSGNIVATQYTHGLFVLAPVYKRACHFEGNVTDSLTGFPLNDVKIEILQAPADTLVLAVDSTFYTGDYKTGIADSGSYDVRFIPTPVMLDSGYVSKTLTGITCDNNLNVKLGKGINGIHENSTSPTLFNVYPNPASQDVIVSIDQSLLNNNHQLILRLIDLTGRTVRELSDIHEELITINRSGIANGSYNLQLLDGGIRIASTTLSFQ